MLAFGIVVVMLGVACWTMRVGWTAAPRALPALASIEKLGALASRPVSTPHQSRKTPAEYALLDQRHPVLAMRSSPANSRGVFTREWLLASAEHFGPIRVEEQVRIDGMGNETVQRRDAFVAGEILARPRDAGRQEDFLATLANAGAVAWQPIFGSAYWVVWFPSPTLDTKPAALAALARHPEIVATAEGNGLGGGCSVPDDPRFPEQYSLQNTGQNGGVAGADTHMVPAWGICHASPDVVVAFLDNGFDFSHPDLAPNRYRAADEIPGNGFDDDDNGFVDDWSGWDFVDNDNDPEPTGDHGTTVMSILGAQGNNGSAIAGVTWAVQLLPVKVTSGSGGGTGTAANFIAGLNYARMRHARVVSASVGGFPYSYALYSAIEAARAADMLLVFAAGNWGADLDSAPHYPACFSSDNILTVANTNNLDELNLGSSCYGLRTVHLGAPGTRIPTIGRNSVALTGTGTSNSTPLVAGVVTLLRQMRPDATVADLKRWILGNVDPLPSLAGRCVSGGRLNAHAALRAAQIFPTITTQPAGCASTPGATIGLAVGATSPLPLRFQWRRNGTDIPGATASSYSIADAQPASAGIYTVVVANSSAAAESQGAIVGLTSVLKVTAGGSEIRADVPHPNGNIYDQVLLTGPATTITADAGQVTRLSFIDLSDDIVQVEFAGPGSLTLTLENATGPAAPAKYNQAVQYMKGHATITLAGVTENSHVSLFTVGTLTAIDQSLFRSGVNYDGVADVALLSIASADGRFGGIRTANAEFSTTRGLTGLNAPGVRIAGPVYLHNVSASDNATPVLLTGEIETGQIGVTGGDLAQPNGRAVLVGEAQRIAMLAGTTSHNVAQPAHANCARCLRNNEDVTAQLVLNPGG